MPASTKIRVFIADEQKEILDQLSGFINAAPDMQVVGTAENGQELVDYFRLGANGVDVALVDIGMPVKDGLTAVSEIRALCGAKPKLVVITGLRGKDYPTDAVSRNADGFFTKFRSKEEILAAVREVFSGSKFVYLRDLNDPSQPETPPKPLPPLIPVERRVLCMLVSGAKSKKIADELKMTVYNVDRIRRLVMHKLGADNPIMLGVIAEKYNLCKPEK